MVISGHLVIILCYDINNVMKFGNIIMKGNIDVNNDNNK